MWDKGLCLRLLCLSGMPMGSGPGQPVQLNLFAGRAPYDMLWCLVRQCGRVGV